VRIMSGHSEQEWSGASLAERIRRLAGGDEEVWRSFHQRYYVWLLRLAASRTSDPSAATEIVQQTYLRVVRHLRPFSDESDLRGWLACLVRCVAVDHARHLNRRAILIEKYAHWRAAHVETDGAWQPANDHASALAEEALSRLAEDEARLLRRKYYDGWSVEQLAVDAGTTSKAIENRLARLRQRLRAIILRIQ